MLIVTLSYFPLVYLPVAACCAGSTRRSRRRPTRSGLGALRDLRPRRRFPQLRPALLGGALLVGLHLLAEFGALQMLRFPTFTTAIYDQYRSTFNGAGGQHARPACSCCCCLLLLLAELRLRGAPPVARVGRGAARPARAGRLGRLAAAGDRWRSPALVVLALGVPLGSLVHWLRRRVVDGVPARRRSPAPR